MSEMNDLKSEREDRYDFARQGWSGFLDEGAVDTEMYLGAQNSKDDEEFARRTGRPIYVINKTKRQVKLLSGYEIRNRHILKMSPIGSEDNESARQHTALITQQMSLFGGYGVMSDCFKMGQLVSGSNLMEIHRDRLGFFRYARLAYNQFLLDPALTFTDLSDCTYYQTGRYMHESTALQLLPENADDINKIPHGQGTQRWDYNHNHGYARQQKMRLYEEYWRRETTFEDTIISRLTAQEIPFKELVKRHGDKNRVEFRIANAKLPNGTPALSRFKKPINKVKLTIYVDSEPVWNDINPLALDDYNVVWFPGEWVSEMDREELKLQSFVRILRDPQKARNRRINQTIDIVESQLTTYRLYKEGSLKNPKDVFQSGQGKVIEVRDDFEGQLTDAFWQAPTPDIPPGFFQMLTLMDKEETDVGGMNEEIFGTDTGDIPAILSRHRTGQALTGHQGLFEGFRIAKQQVGRKQARLNQIWQDPIRVQRMINEMPVKEFYADDMIYYDCNPTEGLLTENQQQSNMRELTEIRSLYPDAAEVITISDIIESSNLQKKPQFMARIKQREQQRDQAAQKQQQEQEQINKLVQAETAAKVARAREDISDIQVNKSSVALKNAQTAGELLNLNNEQLMDLAERKAKVELMRAQTQAALSQASQTTANDKKQSTKGRRRRQKALK